MAGLHRFMTGLATVAALLGGLVLTLLILLTCASVIGRTLNGFLHGAFSGFAPDLAQSLLDLGIGPINGDFELVEAGVAFSVFAFLPLCQITLSHASVDLFTQMLPDSVNKVLRMIIEIVFAIVLVVIALQLYEGLSSKLRYGETTFLLQFPVWWAYAASLFGAVIAAIVGCYMAFVRCVETFSGRIILVDGPEAGH